ncbi:MAG TPA: isoprenylcysteine carboxylmethyltransferase family protein [Anaerolineales bacterium]|nr:isoprenylcysteine carboxylmethyltransferase family protein [Anaerolineales bacterium]
MKKIYPPTLMLFCVLGMIALHSIVPLRAISNPLLLMFGVGLIAFGLVMAFGAEGQFRRSGTTVNPLGTSAKLVTDGWFKFSRNPMYLSMALMLMGAWLALGSISPLLVIFVYLFLTERWYIEPEEKRLNVTFGQEYESYRKRTRRWL